MSKIEKYFFILEIENPRILVPSKLNTFTVLCLGMTNHCVFTQVFAVNGYSDFVLLLVRLNVLLLLLFLHMQYTKIRKHSYMYRIITKDINIQFTIHIYI